MMEDFVCLPRAAPHEPARVWCYRVLLHNIVHLCLPPGSCLVETEVRARLGVSRTPVREALMQLAQEKFVQIVPQKGTYVSRIDMAQVLELRYIRRAAEAEVVREAAGRMTADAVEELRRCLARQEEASERQDFEEFIRVDDAMHQAVYIAAGKGGVWEFFSKNNLHHFRSRILGLRVGRTLSRLIGEHAAIVDALARNDATAAEAAVRRHLSDQVWNADSVLEKYPEYIITPHPE